eukprot:SAG11_NODE_7477_length_1138_cov_2.252166_2_plen_219_part_00
MTDYIRSDFQREDCLHDLLVEYQGLKQNGTAIRQYNTIREEKKMELLNLGIEIDEWMDKSLWLNSITEHLRQTIKKESGYYSLSIEQMLEIAIQHCLDTTHDKTKGQRIARWSLYLSDLNYKARYLKGADNSVADILSRLVSVPTRNWRRDGVQPEIMGSLATLFTSEIPSVWNALSEGHDPSDIEEPHAVEPHDYHGTRSNLRAHKSYFLLASDHLA